MWNELFELDFGFFCLDFVDCFCSVRVIDESYPNPGIAINFFAETMDKLPQVLTVGDIIQLSQVVVTNFASTFACYLFGIDSSLEHFTCDGNVELIYRVTNPEINI